jgi:hypothetical protein
MSFSSLFYDRTDAMKRKWSCLVGYRSKGFCFQTIEEKYEKKRFDVIFVIQHFVAITHK